jgi:hypothetical protein
VGIVDWCKLQWTETFGDVRKRMQQPMQVTSLWIPGDLPERPLVAPPLPPVASGIHSTPCTVCDSDTFADEAVAGQYPPIPDRFWNEMSPEERRLAQDGEIFWVNYTDHGRTMINSGEMVLEAPRHSGTVIVDYGAPCCPHRYRTIEGGMARFDRQPVRGDEG